MRTVTFTRQIRSIDTLAERMKAAEGVEAGRKADASRPLMCRLDGRAFHTLTRGLKRPFDERFLSLMNLTTVHLVEQTQATVGYVQSDEITLCWLPPNNPASGYLFDGRFQKITSVLSGLASAVFTHHLNKAIPEKAGAYPHFDCRAWNADSVRDACLNFIWRQEDAIKNSISMAANAMFSPKELHGVGGEDKKKMLRDKGFDWEQEPDPFKFGSFYRRQTKMSELTPQQLLHIPETRRPTGPVLRTVVERLPINDVRNEIDPEEVLFG